MSKIYRNSLNIDNAVLIDLPELKKPDINKRPQSYWNLFNKGERLYKNKKYADAKETFLQVLKYHNSHKTFRTYLLRTYRKIIKEEIENGKFHEAYGTFKEFFQFCENEITNTDRRKFNKIIENLQKSDSNSNYKKIELLDDPNIKISGELTNKVNLLKETTFKKDNDPRIKNWDYLSFMKTNTLYVGRIYNQNASINDKTFFKIRNKQGDIISEFEINDLIYRFNYSDSSDRFVVSSTDLNFYFYSIKSGLINKSDLKSYSDNKYHLRCVDVSPNGGYVLFTNIDNAYLMNSELKIINIWSTPHKEGLEKRVRGSSSNMTKIDENLAILGLCGNPGNKEIRNAFKKLVIKYHPDQNPNDTKANDKMRELINAYEYLTSDRAENVFKDSNIVEYYSYIQTVKVNIPNTNLSFNIEIGITAPPEDWIYATYLGSNYIYLGCYSGKVYQLTKDGDVTTVYECHDVLKSIKEKDKYLFIEIQNYLYFIKNKEYLRHINIESTNELIWIDDGLLIKSPNKIKIYSNNGLEVSEIEFKNRIYDLYLTEDGFNVITSNRLFEFDLNILPLCIECGTKNPEEAIFCMECGKELYLYSV